MGLYSDLLSYLATSLIAMVHDNREMPLIDLGGYYLTSGRKHEITYTKRANYLLEKPYIGCADTVPLMLQPTFGRFGNADYRYGEFVCFLVCMQAYM
jgi:hypothetical protein